MFKGTRRDDGTEARMLPDPRSTRLVEQGVRVRWHRSQILSVTATGSVLEPCRRETCGALKHKELTLVMIRESSGQALRTQCEHTEVMPDLETTILNHAAGECEFPTAGRSHADLRTRSRRSALSPRAKPSQPQDLSPTSLNPSGHALALAEGTLLTLSESKTKPVMITIGVTVKSLETTGHIHFV